MAQGKIKHWGVSLNTVEECEVAVANGRPAVFQMEYNLLGRDAEAAFKKAKSADVGVVSRVPLKRGFLTGRFPVEHQFADGDVRSRVLTQENMIRFQEKLDKLTEISKQTGISTTEQAIRFCVSNPDVTTVTMGIRTPQQADQACSPGKYIYFGWEDRPPGYGWTDSDYDDIRVVVECPSTTTTRKTVVRLIE